MQIFFLEEQLQEKPIQAGVEIPVDEAKVVASDVISVVGEFDALTFAATAALTLHPTAKDLSADKFQSLQLCKQFRTEQGGFIACVDHSSEPYDGKAVSLVGQGCRGRRIFRLFGQRLEDLQEHFIGFDVFGLCFKIQDHTMSHCRQEHTSNIFKAHVEAAL